MQLPRGFHLEWRRGVFFPGCNWTVNWERKGGTVRAVVPVDADRWYAIMQLQRDYRTSAVRKIGIRGVDV